MTAPTAYLLIQRDDGYGDVFPLSGSARYTMGRAATNRIVLKDELCSREHAEVYFNDGHWSLRDLGSLNGTRLNGIPVAEERPLVPLDEVRLGHSRLVFVEDMQQVPRLSRRPARPGNRVSMRKGPRETRFTTPAAGDPGATLVGVTFEGTRTLERELALLYRLALDMGSAGSQEALVQTVLKGLLEAVPAEVGAILAVRESRDLDLLAYHHRDPNARTYHKVSQFVSGEVISSREAILAEDVASDDDLRKRDSLAELRATSLICTPILFNEELLGLIHLYCVNPDKGLDGDDLEFSIAVANQLGIALHQLRRQDSLVAENVELRSQLRLESELVGDGRAIKDIENQIARVAATKATVLVRGESGVGKELVARAIHYSSPRRDGPFVCLNCAALTETLLESELFGHERGAFTGATEKMIGKFEAAHQGSIFLDEIGEMNLGTQAKLLRVLEGHPFERVGGHTPIKVDVRVVAATNQPLEQGIKEGTFRRDLFYRLQVVQVTVPPLRDRRDDIPKLAEYFLKRFVRETGRKIRGFTPAAIARMQEYEWPGNVRELRNVIERAVALGDGPQLDVPDIWLSSLNLDGQSSTGPAEIVYEAVSLDELEKRHILRSLQHTDWNKSRAAEILGIERSTLDRKIKGYDLRR